MQYKIKLLRTLENSIFGQYEASFESSSPKEIIGFSEVVDKIPKITVNKGDTITVDASPIRDGIFRFMEKDLEVIGLMSIVGQNRDKGALLTITKILN